MELGTQGLTWLGIALLVVQSGTFSGLNLAFFGVSALQLRTLASMGDEQADKVMRMRQDSNFLLTTILWGNVGTNVLLTMLSDSVMAGATAFVFSTFIITFGGEIIPQAYFSRHALRMAGLLSPLLRVYQAALYPLAKPSALVLDAWLGKESVDYIPEDQIAQALRQHVRAPDSEVSVVEGTGAINFMNLDDVLVGEAVDAQRRQCAHRVAGQGGRTFGEMQRWFERAILIGTVRTGAPRPNLNLGPDTVLGADDLLVLVARSYADCESGAARRPVSPRAAVEPLAPSAKAPRRVLILGWSRKLPVLLRELDRHGEAFEVDVVSSTPVAHRERALKRYGGKPSREGVALIPISE